MILQIPFERGQPKGQIKLVPGPFAHSFHGHGCAVGSRSHQDGDILGAEFCVESAEGAAGKALEQAAGSFQEWPLIFLPETLDLRLQELRSQPEPDKPTGVLSQRGGQRLRLLPMVRRPVPGLLELVLAPFRFR